LVETPMANILRIGRSVLKRAYIRLLAVTGLLALAKSRVAKKGIVVLTLHRVLPDAEFDSACSQAGMMLRAGTFDALLQYLKRECYCIALEGVPAWDEHAAVNSRPRIAITFDDGWKDNFETAFPIASRHSVPFTIFICPELINRKQPFWAECVVALWRHAEQAGKLEAFRALCKDLSAGRDIAGCSADVLIERLKEKNPADRDSFIASLQAALASSLNGKQLNGVGEFLNWNEIMQMSETGISFGSHTNTHPILTRVSESETLKELEESKAAIEARLKACRFFAYPNGDWSGPVRELVARCGYQAAFANSSGVWQPGTDLFAVPRVNISENKLTGGRRKFSRSELEYAVFWKAYRASAN
jgi:peptidoglycan/xylan/chitin deacetylase (PgdA/CDA1 family)